MRKNLLLVLLSLSILSVKAQLIVQTGSLSVPRMHHGSVLLNNGKVLVFGGNNGNFLSMQAYNTAQLYNNGTWSNTGTMARKRSYGSAILLSNGNVLAIGGEDDSNNQTASCEIYNVSNGTWSYTDSMTYERSGSKAVTLNNGKILVVGDRYSNTCELYNQTTNTWSVTGSFTIDRESAFDIVKLPNGNVLLVGGSSATAEIYNVSTGTWSPVANQMTYSRAACTAILMNNGKVLIVGGDMTLTSEIFDPATNAFTAVDELINYASMCPMVNLSNGKVLLYGLGDLFSTNRNAIQIFNPTYNNWSSGGVVSASIFSANVYTIHKLPTNKILIIGGNFTTGNGASNYCYLINESNISSDVNDLILKASIDIFPNPSQNLIRVQSDQPLKGAVFSVVDQLGKIVIGDIFEDNNISIDISTLESGVYFLKIGSDKPKTFKFTKY